MASAVEKALKGGLQGLEQFRQGRVAAFNRNQEVEQRKSEIEQNFKFRATQAKLDRELRKDQNELNREQTANLAREAFFRKSLADAVLQGSGQAGQVLQELLRGFAAEEGLSNAVKNVSEQNKAVSVTAQDTQAEPEVDGIFESIAEQARTEKQEAKLIAQEELDLKKQGQKQS